jgi:hypothetical protein
MGHQATFKLAGSVTSGVLQVEYNFEFVAGDSVRQRWFAFADAVLPAIWTTNDELHS